MRIPLARVGAASTVLAVGAGVALVLGNQSAPGAAGPADVARTVVGALAFGLLGGLVADRRPANGVGWLLLTIGACHALGLVGGEYGYRGVVTDPGSLPLAPLAVWLSLWIWVPAYTLLPTVLVLLVPTGRIPSRRWRPALVLAWAAVVAASAGWALLPYDDRDAPLADGLQDLTNPVGTAVALPVVNVAFLLLLLATLAAVASLVVRYRRATATERQQLKIVVVGVVLTLVCVAAGLVLANDGDVFGVLAVLPIPLALTVAVLRHRLWEIDRLVDRSLVYAGLTAAVAIAYVGIVALLGDQLGRRTGAPLVAAVVVAVGAQPLRERLQRSVNRLLHGDRDDPYLALRRVTESLEAAAGPERALPEVVAAVARALRSPYVAMESTELPPVAHGAPVDDVVDVPLVHQGQAVGLLRVGARSAGEAFAPSDLRLLDDLARQAATAAHAAQLQEHLQRSREAAVLGREEERRRLRRELHDGVGPALAAVALQLEALHGTLDDPDRATALVDRTVDQLRATVGDVRRLVDDLRPPALDDLGLVGALAQEVHRFSGPALQVRLDACDDLDGLPAAVEVAVFRIASEALANVARHSGAGTCTVSLRRTGDAVELAVVDDGSGIPPDWVAGVGLLSMHERAAELGGECTLGPGVEGGTTVRVTLPVGTGATTVAST